MLHTNTDNGCAEPSAGEKIFLTGCGILAREVRSLIAKNSWPMETVLLDSALHIDFGTLGTTLTSTLSTRRGRSTIVFYGCCHPRIDEIVSEAGAVRTRGQNCAEMLLGSATFNHELENGAYFLFESLARNWKRVIEGSFGTSQPDVIRAIFGEDRKYLLALRTPCSGDYSAAAEEAGRIAGLPVRWMDVRLDHLEQTLHDALRHSVDGSAPWTVR
jgi:hypothetical protein